MKSGGEFNLSDEYDSIILAAGRNTRLKGIIPSYHKPLVLVNGVPLIVSLVSDALAFTQRVIVVVSPENCAPIIDLLAANDLLSHRVKLVVQAEARGPGDSLYQGLAAAQAERVVLICGDNRIPTADFRQVIDADALWRSKYEASKIVTACTSLIRAEDSAIRFTRVDMLKKEFVEGRPGGFNPASKGYICWIGPLVFDRVVAEKIFEGKIVGHKPGDPEIKISEAFNVVEDLLIISQPGSSFDIGTKESLEEA
mgnify:CR=1 FL=1